MRPSTAAHTRIFRASPGMVAVAEVPGWLPRTQRDERGHLTVEIQIAATIVQLWLSSCRCHKTTCVSARSTFIASSSKVCANSHGMHGLVALYPDPSNHLPPTRHRVVSEGPTVENLHVIGQMSIKIYLPIRAITTAHAATQQLG
jgi:hypothetical protein